MEATAQLLYSQESEMMVLGSMLNSLNITVEALNASDFYRPEHQVIFDVLRDPVW